MYFDFCLFFDYFFPIIFIWQGWVSFECGGLQDPTPKLMYCSTKTISVSHLALHISLANALIYNLWWIVAYVLTVFCRQMWASVPAWLEAMCLWLVWGQNQAVKLYPCHGLLMWICCLAMWLLRYFQMQVEKADVLLQKIEPSFD